jgi:hypothetical protein
MDVSGQLHVLVALHPGREPRYPQDTPLNPYERCGEEKNLLFSLIIEPQFLGLVQ